jgi:hypothetical protein
MKTFILRKDFVEKEMSTPLFISAGVTCSKDSFLTSGLSGGMNPTTLSPQLSINYCGVDDFECFQMPSLL